uniref:Uncharacterized protein n=1 Tax=Lepeophtheirus salmonis TaxID=72036 RepID=A0A0K2U3V6_LEPSM
MDPEELKKTAKDSQSPQVNEGQCQRYWDFTHDCPESYEKSVWKEHCERREATFDNSNKRNRSPYLHESFKLFFDTFGLPKALTIV